MTSVDRKSTAWTTGAALAALVFVVLSGCGTGQVPLPSVSEQGHVMGTQWHVRYVNVGAAANPNLKFIIEERSLQSIVYDLSTYEPASMLSRFNAGDSLAPVALTSDQHAILQIALEVCAQTGGAFDPTVLPLVEAWGFGATEATHPPSDDLIRGLLDGVVGCDKLVIESSSSATSHTLRKAVPAASCDLSAVAKGYAVDRVARALEQVGITNYMVEIGGEVHVRGVNATGVPWRIGIQSPDAGNPGIQRVVSLVDRSMATSGDYRNFRVEDGKRYSHIIDPRTGRPITHGLASVSVLHKECAWADAYATAIMVLGPEAGFDFADEHGLEVFMIVHDGDGFVEKMTPGFEMILLKN